MVSHLEIVSILTSRNSILKSVRFKKHQRIATLKSLGQSTKENLEENSSHRCSDENLSAKSSVAIVSALVS